ncbi:hypothetical protein BQ8420_14565 [Nocardiopsis sp. JB363]|nr:hypothetical protein BQ8420_14565 [Nocardiopsis sp. JB363]
MTTATVLLALIQEDAPAALWELAPDGRTLAGELFGAQEDRRPAMVTWQRVIGTGPVVSTCLTGRDEYLVTRDSYEGISVTVIAFASPEHALAERLKCAAQELDDDVDGATLTGVGLRVLLEGNAA